MRCSPSYKNRTKNPKLVIAGFRDLKKPLMMSGFLLGGDSLVYGLGDFSKKPSAVSILFAKEMSD